MATIELIRPNPEHEMQALGYIKEHEENNEFELHGGAILEKAESYKSWLKQLADNSNKMTVRKDWVLSTTFFAVRKSDRKIIGMADIRHEMNDFLRSYGGQIGIGIRPSERKNGYATEITKMAIQYCKEIGLSEVMVACYKENTASRKIILKCQGILEKEFIYNDHKVVQVYWITL